MVRFFELIDRDALVAAHCIQSAGEMVGERVTDALTQLDHPDVRDRALALYEKSQRQADACQRARAVYLLGWMSGNPPTSKLLIEALSDSDRSVRGYAMGAMARLDLHHARELIEEMLDKESDPWVLRKAAETLGQIGTVDSIAVLERHLRHKRARTRWMVRRAIAEIQQRQAL